MDSLKKGVQGGKGESEERYAPSELDSSSESDARCRPGDHGNASWVERRVFGGVDKLRHGGSSPGTGVATGGGAAAVSVRIRIRIRSQPVTVPIRAAIANGRELARARDGSRHDCCRERFV